jgi:transmembrane sensor
MQNLAAQLEYLHAHRASVWVEALRDAGPQQRAEFIAWLKESPRNVQELLLILAVDRALEQVDALHLQDIEALLRQVDAQVVGFPAAPQQGMRGPNSVHYGRWFGLAASFVVVSVIGWWLLGRTGVRGVEVRWQEYQTAKSEQRAFELEDGTVIHLNIDSHVAVHFSPQERLVRLLGGEALFKVRHDTNRPFRVYTSDAVIQDVGTEFNVYSRADATVIAVLEGRVNVSPQEHAALSAPAISSDQLPAAVSSAPLPTKEARTLSVNQEAQVSHSGAITVHTLRDASDAVAWRQRRLVFRQQTLQHIIEEFNRYGQRRIRLEGTAVLNQRFSGVFDADDPESLVQVLARESDLAVEQSADGFVIRSR